MSEKKLKGKIARHFVALSVEWARLYNEIHDEKEQRNLIGKDIDFKYLPEVIQNKIIRQNEIHTEQVSILEKHGIKH